MKISAFAPLLLSTLVASKSIGSLAFPLGGSVQTPFDDDKAVPGDSPLQYCSAEHSDDKIRIDSVDLTPNPPQAGQSLLIEAKGEILEDIGEGAYVQLSVKYGCCITLIKTTRDVCEQVKEVDLECPLKKGPVKITKEVDIPSPVPPGKYTVFADVYTVDDEHVTCLTAQVSFGGA